MNLTSKGHSSGLGRMVLCGVIFSLSVCLGACRSLITFNPSQKYDNQTIRGSVIGLYSKQMMERNWDNVVQNEPDVPAREDYVKSYRRVTVAAGRSFRGGFFAHPFVPEGMDVDKGDVVDIRVPSTQDIPENRTFASRLKVLRVVCKYSDRDCLESTEGRRRGILASP
jgi:hypothetical protein